MIVSLKNQATEDIFYGNNTKISRKICPQSIWRVAFKELKN